MDPQVTWNQLLDAWVEAEWERVVFLADALLQWIENGGFPPETNANFRMGAEWNLAIVPGACKFAAERAREVLSHPRQVPASVPFSLSCASCNNEGPASLEAADLAGWKEVTYIPTGISENFLAYCPECQRLDSHWDSVE